MSAKKYKQNPSVEVEIMQLIDGNAEEIVKWINHPSTELYKSYTDYKKTICTVSIYFNTPHGKSVLRYGEFLVRYTENKVITYQALTKDELSKRFVIVADPIQTSTSLYNQIYTDTYHNWTKGF